MCISSIVFTQKSKVLSAAFRNLRACALLDSAPQILDSVESPRRSLRVIALQASAPLRQNEFFFASLSFTLHFQHQHSSPRPALQPTLKSITSDVLTKPLFPPVANNKAVMSMLMKVGAMLIFKLVSAALTDRKRMRRRWRVLLQLTSGEIKKGTCARPLTTPANHSWV